MDRAKLRRQIEDYLRKYASDAQLQFILNYLKGDKK